MMMPHLPYFMLERPSFHQLPIHEGLQLQPVAVIALFGFGLVQLPGLLVFSGKLKPDGL
jgi:hypothetical protein